MKVTISVKLIYSSALVLMLCYRVCCIICTIFVTHTYNTYYTCYINHKAYKAVIRVTQTLSSEIIITLLVQHLIVNVIIITVMTPHLSLYNVSVILSLS